MNNKQKELLNTKEVVPYSSRDCNDPKTIEDHQKRKLIDSKAVFIGDDSLVMVLLFDTGDVGYKFRKRQDDGVITELLFLASREAAEQQALLTFELLNRQHEQKKTPCQE